MRGPQVERREAAPDRQWGPRPERSPERAPREWGPRPERSVDRPVEGRDWGGGGQARQERPQFENRPSRQVEWQRGPERQQESRGQGGGQERGQEQRGGGGKKEERGHRGGGRGHGGD